jgi:methionine sulfoxide reductase catalytic subunit
VFLGLSGLGAATLLFGQTLTGSDGQGSLITDILGQGGFRIYTVAPIPKFDPASWKLTIGGLASKSLQLSYDDLLALPSKVQSTVFHCVTGWSVDNLTWEGVPLQTIIDMAAPSLDARAITFYSSDGAYTDSLTLDQAQASDVLLAYNMNGQPLPLNQGMPVRLLVPEMFGYKGVKWVNKIEFAAKPISGYWEVRGYDVDAYINKPNSPSF